MDFINTGKITEEELLFLFASEKQKDKYISSGNRFVSSNKQTVLRQARKECEIVDLGNREYEITKIYRYPVPKNFDKMNCGIHQYLTPLILMNLIAAKIYEVKNITFTCMKWYRMTEMINDNYINMKYNIDYSSEKLTLNKNALYDFFETTDDSLIYYFKKSLEYLKAANLFNFQEINWICVMDVDESNNENKARKVKINYIHRRAEHEEMKFVRRCEELACQHVGINSSDDTEKYYGKQSHEYMKRFKELLLERKIMFCYKAYEIYSTDRDIERCHQLLSNFEMKDKSDLITNLNAVFQRNIIINAQNRVASNPEKRKLFTTSDINDFITDYKKITMLTLDITSETISVPRKAEMLHENMINEIIDSNLQILVNGEKIAIGMDDRKI